MQQIDVNKCYIFCLQNLMPQRYTDFRDMAVKFNHCKAIVVCLCPGIKSSNVLVSIDWNGDV